MLPVVYQERYQELHQRLQIWQTAHDRSDPWQAPAVNAEIEALQTQWQILRQLEEPDLEPRLAHHLQALQVEIDKQLRLLRMDSQFLQAARQASTADQRRQQMRTRLALLLRYLEAVLGSNSDDRDNPSTC